MRCLKALRDATAFMNLFACVLPFVEAFVRIPKPGTSKKTHPGQALEAVRIRARVDKHVRRMLSEFGRLGARLASGQISPACIALIFTALWGSYGSIYRHRSAVNRALRQLPFGSKLRRYAYWRWKRAKQAHRRSNSSAMGAPVGHGRENLCKHQ